MTNTTAATTSTDLTEAGSGKTVIVDGVVSKVAGIAAAQVPGVHALGGGVTRAIGAIREAINQTDKGQGVSVEVGDTQAAVDITLVAEYPVSLQKVADDVREAVTTAIEQIVGLEVTEVNVTINDVHLPTDDDAEQHDARVQ
ncbi:Asp23/Gls24 family envelope stress response protein [Labedella endophytica]|jgi:uncharacterized alkaline shock family protein YloU|uniref:Asp23/Gls24 family envelope stress response protein n=1 Tax=Labedella endophytica TaxID=1523160 RepID=A0A3S0WZA8_9MICO|nr:Asp23/Gls24 family envelope stress response protein [Labedella endophytica]RUR01786.1 Asp23/Gls24 family envelope stress response protein [Labedella endophytica]